MPSSAPYRMLCIRKMPPARHHQDRVRRGVRRSQLHSASAGAAKAPYSQPPSSFPKADRCAGSPFGSNKKRKETTGEPFEWFPGPSIDQSLALDLRRMEVLAFAVFAGREMSAISKIACGTGSASGFAWPAFFSF
mgnify:CR=1 FL=1